MSLKEPKNDQNDQMLLLGLVFGYVVLVLVVKGTKDDTQRSAKTTLKDNNLSRHDEDDEMVVWEGGENVVGVGVVVVMVSVVVGIGE